MSDLTTEQWLEIVAWVMIFIILGCFAVAAWIESGRDDEDL